MFVSDVMTRAVRTATPETDLYEVATVICLHRLSGLPVVNENDKVVGFIAERDILHRMFPRLEDLMDQTAVTDFEEMERQYGDVMNLKVKDVMITGVISVSPEMPLLKATSVMVRHKFRRIPVAKDGILLGMISIGDIHKAIFQSNLTFSR